MKIIKPTQLLINYTKKTLNHAIKIYMGVAFGEGIFTIYYYIFVVQLIYRLFFFESKLNMATNKKKNLKLFKNNKKNK